MMTCDINKTYHYTVMILTLTTACVGTNLPSNAKETCTG